MKNLFSLLCIISIFSCAPLPKAFIQTDDICHFQDSIFVISVENKFLDVIKYYNSKKHKGKIIIKENEKEDISLNRWEENGHITYSNVIKDLNIEKSLWYSPNGYLKRVKFYFLDGSTPIYKESHFDEQGNITKVIDYEKGYNICWAEAIEIVKTKEKRLIEKYQITEFYAVHNDLNEFPDLHPIWYIGLKKGNEIYWDESNKKGSITFKIDGVTGKILGSFREKTYPS